MFGDNLDAIEQRIVDWQSTLEARARRAADVAKQLQTTRFTGSVAGGLVVATVDHAGHLVDLTLHQRVRDWPAARIAKAVLVAAAAARDAMTAHVRDLMAEAGFDHAGQ
ncbi:YbaB/EbfC family nucleoid-associated protein [Allorhizocola rhizosphaerae]|uniref:YbaB/EbfC family nucleoid-associated protein n=1 Tax=Allorhizocola rhizosphaerae TaxID=1872709 RepID=UPI000E3B6601|nr:YbaB/EbfC family nucleoid-associated protein [Allorhizocola rhizosphaerae]